MTRTLKILLIVLAATMVAGLWLAPEATIEWARHNTVWLLLIGGVGWWLKRAKAK
jgi:hypothetical protein